MKYIFEPILNLFDLLTIIIIGSLMSTVSVWLVLLILPISIFSARLQRKYWSE